MDELLSEITSSRTLVLLIMIIVGLTIEHRTGWFSQRHKKELTYQIISEINLIKDPELDEAEEIKIFVKGLQVSAVSLLLLRIKNTGNQPIISTDYEEPIEISFHNYILSHKIENVVPEDLKVNLPLKLESPGTVDPSYSSFNIEPLLLNSGDTIDISVLIEGEAANNLQIKGRIIGVKHIKEIPSGLLLKSISRGDILLVIIAMYLANLLNLLEIFGLSTSNSTKILVSFFVIFVFAIVIYFRSAFSIRYRN